MLVAASTVASMELKTLLILLVAPMAMANMHGHLRKALFDSYDSMARPDHLVELESGFTLLKMHLCSHKDVGGTKVVKRIVTFRVNLYPVLFLRYCQWMGTSK